MAKLLTVRKQKWVSQFKPDILRGAPLNPNAASESRYYLNLTRLINQMTEETERQIKKLFHSQEASAFFAQDKSIAAQAKILTNALTKKFEDLFATSAQPLAERMVNQEDKNSSASLHQSLQQLSGGLSLSTKSLNGPLTEVLNASITENVALIKSIPAQYLSGVQGAVMRSITTGNGLQDLVPYLANHKGITLRRARFIAKDQTKKAYENLTTGRMKNLGLEEFEWLHTGGSNHPRKSHITMTGKIYKLNEGAYDSEVKKYILPGELPGCRCRKVPVIRFGKE